ncbi:gamma-aminobutyric acid receptor subunit gamma-2-like [Penaeus monodon]|uniref:gamma-aminobutyric acid receptor subunit gamma-2-like n=1 Tax=Penaeus monodon TaxID=6687 RepID=UPI0018A76D9A|nr:gamma-aminobutyric acid receptor subunit gamma-2-like [Penaeus monodon]
MGRSLPGWKQNLSVYSECRVTLPCNFQFHRFPFGSHVCNGTFYFLKAAVEMMWKRKTTVDDAEYNGDSNLLDFRLVNVTSETAVTPLTDGKELTFLVISLHLQSLFDYHLLNSFGPSALMFVICYATLFIPISDFNERIMVSLTAMLVLAALFSQATDSYVKTPYFKLIDIWYAIIIALCFIIVLVNVGVNRVRLQGGYEALEGVPKERGRADWTNMVCKILILLVFVILVLVFALFAAEIV